MKINVSISIFLFFLLASQIGCKSSNKAISHEEDFKKTKRVIILGLDGLSVPGYKTAKHPNLDYLMENGVLSLDTRAVFPSVTLPNWTSHLTGSGPEQHGVNNNGWTLENLVLPPIERDSEGYYPSVFKILKDKVPNMKTAYYYNWGNLINPINQKYLDEVNFEEDDKYLYNYGMALDFAEKNRYAPTFIFLYTVHTDHAGHKYKWMSPQYISAIEEADKAIGKLIDDLKSAQLYEDTHFILITDHGGKDEGHGGFTPVEMEVPWAISGLGIQKGKMLSEPNNNTNTAVVILRLFDIHEIPKSWVGEVPESIFE